MNSVYAKCGTLESIQDADNEGASVQIISVYIGQLNPSIEVQMMEHTKFRSLFSHDGCRFPLGDNPLRQLEVLCHNQDTVTQGLSFFLRIQ